MRARGPEKLRALANPGERAVLLIHGDYGSGKSAVLRALEETPPAGLRAVYVPVPTLDFSGIARWCLDCLGAPATSDPAAALRTAAGRSHVLLLVDDADRLALDVALALRQLERDANGGVAIAAACGSDCTESPSIVALGPPQRAFEVAAGEFERTAREVRGALEAHAEPAAAHGPRRASLAKAATANAARRAALAASALEPRPAPADDAKSQRLAPVGIRPVAPAPSRSRRSVPLSVAIAACAVAFAVPVAFLAGFVLGRGGEPAPALARDSSPLARVSAPPPEEAPPARDESTAAVASSSVVDPLPAGGSDSAAETPAPEQRIAAAEPLSAPAREEAASSETPAAAPPAEAPPARASTNDAGARDEDARSEVANADAPAEAAQPATAEPSDPPKGDAPARTAAAAPARERRRDSDPTVEPSWGAPKMIRVSPADEAN
jgi:hypothetical protein